MNEIEKQKIYKIVLNKIPYYLKPPKGERNMPSIDADTAILWWRKSDQNFKSKINKPTQSSYNLETIGYFVGEDQDVMFFSSSMDRECSNFKHIRVSSKENIKKIEELHISPNKRIKSGGPVMLIWEDPVLSSYIGTLENLKKRNKIPQFSRVGFLLSDTNKGVYTASLFSGERDLYSETMVNPKKSVKEIHPLI